VGFDLRLYPVRLDSAAVALIRADAGVWEQASLHPPFGAIPDEPVPEISHELTAAVPAGFELTKCFLDRSFDQAEYILDPVGHRTRTSWLERQQSMPYRIIHGDQPFAPHARGGQGVPWRCSTAAFLAEAAATIDALDVAAARREFSVAQMHDLGIYKAFPGPPDDEVFARVLGNLHQLAVNYRRLAGTGLDAIITMD
jgi:hypothetical protein